MSKFGPTTISADGTSQLCFVNRRRADCTNWLATIVATGSFGGGTITWQMSPDGGTTKTTLKDLSGNNVTSTAADNFNVQLGNGGTNSDAIILYAVMAGSSSPTVSVNVFDNG